MTTPAQPPTPVLVSSINWQTWVGQFVCIVDQTSGDVALGVLDSVRWNLTNGVYWVGVTAAEQRLVGSDMVTIVQVTAANKNNPVLLGLTAQITVGG